MTILIKKYINRKLYLIDEGRYTDLKEIATMIKAGKTIKVTHNATKQDITNDTLSQVLLLKTLPEEVLFDLLTRY